MYLILVYDVNVKRVNKVLKICRRYLNWVQNSVLEGELSDAAFKKLKAELFTLINEDEDSIIMYKMRTTRYSEREIMGQRKGGEELIL